MNLDKQIKSVVVTYHDKKGWWIFKRHTRVKYSLTMWNIHGDKIRSSGIAKTITFIYK